MISMTDLQGQKKWVPGVWKLLGGADSRGLDAGTRSSRWAMSAKNGLS
jgi:hypothetical protein